MMALRDKLTKCLTWHQINTDEKNVIILSIWIEENLGAETEFVFGDCENGNALFFGDEEDAMAFKLRWR